MDSMPLSLNHPFFISNLPIEMNVYILSYFIAVICKCFYVTRNEIFIQVNLEGSMIRYC